MRGWVKITPLENTKRIFLQNSPREMATIKNPHSHICLEMIKISGAFGFSPAQTCGLNSVWSWSSNFYLADDDKTQISWLVVQAIIWNGSVFESAYFSNPPLNAMQQNDLKSNTARIFSWFFALSDLMKHKYHGWMTITVFWKSIVLKLTL